MKPLVFQLRGTTVKAHVSILLLFAYLLYQGWRLNLPAWHITTACAILLGSVFIHELGHVLAFRRLLGIRSHVWIFAVGGVTIPLEKAWMYRGWRMALVAFAGPLANFLLAVFSLVLVVCSNDMVTLQLAFTSLVLNAVMGIFNLVPTKPFDGGHVFAAIVEWALWRTPRLSDFVVGAFGTLCGFCLLTAAVSLHDPLLGLGGAIAIFANTPLARVP